MDEITASETVGWIGHNINTDNNLRELEVVWREKGT